MFYQWLPIVLLSIHLIALTSGAALSSSQQFTFVKPTSLIKLKPEWPLYETREISFKFKTEKPHGLLFYHRLSDTPEESHAHYELYVMLENGKLKIIHVFNAEDSEIFYTGKGLNRDRWHHVAITIFPKNAEMVVKVDHSEPLKVPLPSLQKPGSYGSKNEDIPSVIHFGSTDHTNDSTEQHYNTLTFFGCLGNINLSYGDQLEHSGNPVILLSDVKEGCTDLCEKNDFCLNGGKCINHYTYTTCDCFGTKYEDHMCGYDNLTTVTLRGFSYITYRVYDWKDRVHSDVNRISLIFRLYAANGVLFSGSGEHEPKNYVTASVKDGRLYFEINFGNGSLSSTIGSALHDMIWHNLTIFHHTNTVTIYLDKEETVLKTNGGYHHLHLDPELFIGGAPHKNRGLASDLPLVGCLREVYFNQENILLALRKNDPNARHHGVFPAEYGCAYVDTLPLTFPFMESRLKLNPPINSKHLELSIDFKTSQNETVVASGLLKSESGSGFWEIRLKKGTAIFSIVPDERNPQHNWFLSKGKQLTDGQWHQVGVVFDSGHVELEIDYKYKLKDQYSGVSFYGHTIIGAFPNVDTLGFVGCVRDIYLDKVWVDPRTVLNKEFSQGEVSMDNCRLINPCNNPSACEHGGRCYVEGSQVKCDCSGSGYTGKTCHFSTYKRTCQELYLVGYRESGTYKIDIDRNGPLPPAHVECDMKKGGDEIITKISHNMPREMVVRKYGMDGFFMDITYREFNPEMLQSLIRTSITCSQTISYECFKTPLGLQIYTWMESSSNSHYVSSIGSEHPAWCQCAELGNCANMSLKCNCDIADNRWRLDSGVYNSANDLGITRIYVLQPKGLAHDAEARMTLGDLQCTDTNTQKYVITFKTAPSYLEVQTGWRRGDLAFSFRTSSKRAVVLYQAALHSKHGYLLAMITSDYELSFEYTVNGSPRTVKLASRRKLNTGEWQQVWLDHDTHHMRFTVNLDSVMVDLAKNEEVGPFEGPLYIGGAPKHLLTHPEITEGFIGCFRGLIINNEVVDLYKHVTKRIPDIVKYCQPSCSSNPCLNGATCHENWGSYHCECANPLAHSGTNCENNLNQNSMTFITSSSCFHRATLGDSPDPVLKEDILLSFRTYQMEALLLYSFDHYNNFVQLHFDKGRRVLFTFNTERRVVQGIVDIGEPLANGQIVQVHVKRLPNSTFLYVNGVNTTINYPNTFLQKYYKDPWIEGSNLELVKPARGTFESVSNSQMYLGGVDFRGATTNLPGLVGCLQGLRIGSAQIDLEKGVEDKNMTKGQIRSGCRMMCDSKPCHHNGLCIEDWKNNLTSCDCKHTSYRGDICDTDIGTHFDGKSVLEYMFTPESYEVDRITVHLAFSTEAKANVRQAILLIQYAQTQYYVLVAVTPEGSLQIQENHSTSKVFGKQDGNFADGFRHWLRYERHETDAKITIDGKTIKLTSTTPDTTAPKIHDLTSSLVIVGGTNRDPRFGDYGSFQGCVSNTIVELPNLNIQPLETYFGYLKGALEKVKVHGTLKEGKCSEFAAILTTVTEAPFIPPRIEAPEWGKVNPVMHPYKNHFLHPQATKLLQAKITSTRVAVIMAVLLIVVLIAVFFYAWKLQKQHKHRKLQEDLTFFRKGSYAANAVKRKSSAKVSYAGRNSVGGDYHAINHAKEEIRPLRKSIDYNSTVPKEKPPKVIEPEKPKAIPNLYSPLPLSPVKAPPVATPLMYDEPDMGRNHLGHTVSQELEWDPAADNADLITAAMNEMNPGDDGDEEIGKIFPDSPPDSPPTMSNNSFHLAEHSGSLVFVNQPYE